MKEIRSFPSLLNQLWIAAASPAWPPKQEGNEGTQLDMRLPEAPQSNGRLQPGLALDQRQNARGAQPIPSSAGLCWSALTQSIPTAGAAGCPAGYPGYPKGTASEHPETGGKQKLPVLVQISSRKVNKKQAPSLSYEPQPPKPR